MHLSDTEKVSSNGTDLVLDAVGSIVSHSNLLLPLNRQLNFGDTNNKVYLSGSGSVMFEVNQDLHFLTKGSAVFDKISFPSGLTFEQSAMGGLNVISPNIAATVSLFKTRCESLAVTGTTTLQDDLLALKNATVNGNLFVDGSLNAGTFISAPRVDLHGSGVALVSSWDGTAGYGISRGTSNLAGGRGLFVAVPLYESYNSLGSLPTIAFGAGANDVFLTTTKLETRIHQGTLTVDDALLVRKGISAKSLTIDSFLIPDSVRADASGLNAKRVTAENAWTASDSGITHDAGTMFHGSARFLGGISAETPVVFSEGLSMNGTSISNLAMPTESHQACPKAYVDLIKMNLPVKGRVRAASTENVSLSMPASIVDGVTLALGDRVLLKNQADGRENGIYVLDDELLPGTRSTDLVDGTDAMGSLTYVEDGFENGKTTFMASALTTSAVTITVGTDVMAWTPFSGASSIQSGPGLYARGNVLEVMVNQKTIEIGNDGLTLAQPGRGLTFTDTGRVCTSTDQRHVSMVGRIDTGTWCGSTVEVPFGGTGMVSVDPGKIVYGGARSMTTSNLFTYAPIAGVQSIHGLGLGTSSPASEIHAASSRGAALLLEGTTAGSSPAIALNSLSASAKITLRQDGALYIGQESETPASSLVFATQHQQRLSIDHVGTIAVAKNLTVGGNLQGLTARLGAVAFQESQISLTNGTTLDVIASKFTVSGSITASGCVFGALTIRSLSPIETVASFDGSLALGIATLNEETLFTPSLTFGGSSRSLGITARSQSPGVVVMQSENVSLNMAAIKVTLGDTIFRDPSNPSDALSLKCVGSTVTIGNPNNQTTGLLELGKGPGDLVTKVVNTDGSAFLQFSPTAGGTASFVVSEKTTSFFEGNVTMSGNVFINDAAMIPLRSAGWHHLGRLSPGKTTVSLPNAFRVTFTYDGLWPYTASTMINDRSRMDLVVYRTETGYQLFALTRSTGVVVLRVDEAPNPLIINQHEGVGISPNGAFSHFTNSWVLDWSLSTAAASLPFSVGSLQAAGTSVLDDVTVRTALDVIGPISCRGDVAFSGSKLSYQAPLGSSFDVSPDPSGNLVIDAKAAPGGTARLNLGDAVSFAGTISGDQRDGLTVTAPNSFCIRVADKSAPLLKIGELGAVVEGTLKVTGPVQIVESMSVDKTINAYGLTIGTVNVSMATDGALSLNSRRLSDIAAPIFGSDACTKEYCDIVGKGTARTVTVASVRSVALTDPQPVMDGTLIYPGYTILLKDQANPVENGIYLVEPGFYLSRSELLPEDSLCSGVTVWVSHGDVNRSCAYMSSNLPGSDVVAVDDLTFVQVSNVNEVTAGPGLRKRGNQLDVQLDNVSLEMHSNSLRLSSAALSQGLSGGSGFPIRVTDISHLDTLGVIHSGIWEASAIDMSHGGTGSTGFPVGSVPFSNGSRLTSGLLHYDEIHCRLGINTSTPTSGLSLMDRDASLTQSGAAPSAIIFSSVTTGVSFALRNDASRFILSAGMGTDKSVLSDVVSVNSSGLVICPSGVSTEKLQLAGTLHLADSIAKLSAGPYVQNLYSLDNTGSMTCWYGAVGGYISNSDSEFARCGYYNGRFVLQTSATGAGTARSLTLQSGNNTNQVVLRNDGEVIINGNDHRRRQVLAGFFGWLVH